MKLERIFLDNLALIYHAWNISIIWRQSHEKSVFLEISEAFDKVKHDGFIFKTRQSWITFKVHNILGKTETSLNEKAGVSRIKHLSRF